MKTLTDSRIEQIAEDSLMRDGLAWESDVVEAIKQALREERELIAAWLEQQAPQSINKLIAQQLRENNDGT